jgi:hypothetical protein
MKVVFAYGWGVTNTDTYDGLPAALARNAPKEVSIQSAHGHLNAGRAQRHSV